MNRKLQRHSLATAATCLFLLTACGGSGGGGSGVEPNTTPDPEVPITPGNGQIPTLPPTSSITIDPSRRIVNTSANPQGTEVLIATTPSVSTPGQLDVPTMTIYDATTGAELRSLTNVPTEIDPAYLFWSDSQISALLFPTFSGDAPSVVSASWDVQTGALTGTISSQPGSACDETLGGRTTFDASANTAYAAAPLFQPAICKLDFTASTIEEYSTELSVPLPGVSANAMALSADGSTLWISYARGGLTAAGTQQFDTATFSEQGAFVTAKQGTVISVNEGFQLFSTNESGLVVFPDATILDGSRAGLSTSANGQVVAWHDVDNTRLVALPELVYIGQLDKDVDRLRSFSANGNTGVFVVNNTVHIHALTARSTISAVQAPATFPQTFSGTITIDGLAQAFNGTCNTDIQEAIGPNIVDVEATLDDGSRFTVRAQNGLANTSYALIEGQRFTDTEMTFEHSFVLAANFTLEQPEIFTDGTAITGSSLLYQFDPNELADLITDPSDSTGFATRSMLFDATCT